MSDYILEIIIQNESLTFQPLQYNLHKKSCNWSYHCLCSQNILLINHLSAHDSRTFAVHSFELRTNSLFERKSANRAWFVRKSCKNRTSLYY